ncbi:MAG: GntR family transcriptional regulator [Candidatus Dormibacteraceae bacterium]
MSSIAPLPRDPALTERVYKVLKAAIVNVDIEPGTQLVESDIAARMEVSKSPVRDALQRLAGEGLVARNGAKGLAVRRLTPEEADEIYAVREVLEAFAVELATPRLSVVDHRKLRAILSQCKDATDADDRATLAALNRQFHGFFAEHSGNATLEHLLARLNTEVRIISVLGWRKRPAMRTEYDQHVAIAEASISGDTTTAMTRVRSHIHEFRIALSSGWGHGSAS